MKHDDAPPRPSDAALDDLLAGDLAPGSDAERDLLATASADDGALRDELAAHRALREQVRALPRELAPGRDLWPEIASRVGAADVEHGGAAGAFWERTVSVPRWAALAALLAVAVGVGLLVGYERAFSDMAPVAVSSPVPPSGVAPAANGRTDPVLAASGAGRALAAYAETDRELATIREELWRSIEARQAKLPPETRAVVFENLRTIERAIDEIEAALAATPADQELARTYIAYRERQIAVLRQANELAARL
jgi:hypothetical protein